MKKPLWQAHEGCRTILALMKGLPNKVFRNIFSIMYLHVLNHEGKEVGCDAATLVGFPGKA